MVESLAIGVDIGGSHVTAAVVDLDKQTILAPTITRQAVNGRAGAEEIIAAWCCVISECSRQLSRESLRIGIAMPGPFDYEKGIAFMQEQNKYDSLYGLNVKNLLAKGLEIAPDHILFVNDAACFLKGEVFGGAAKGCHNVLGLTLGTGFGTAIYQNGVVTDANLWCDPYREGIAEDLLSTRWFVNRFYACTGKRATGVKEMVEDESGNAVVRQIFETFGRNLGEYLVSISDRFAFDTVVIGGNIARSYSLFAATLQQVFSEHKKAVSVRYSVLQENAALVGAASSWKPASARSAALTQQDPAPNKNMANA